MRHLAFAVVILAGCLPPPSTSPPPVPTAGPASPKYTVAYQGQTADQWLIQLHDRDASVHLAAQRALISIGAEAAPGLADALSDDPQTAMLAVHALWQIGPAASAALPKLSAARKDPARQDEPFHRIVVQAIGMIKGEIPLPSDPQYTPKMIQILSTSKDPEYRLVAAGDLSGVDAWGQPRSPDIVPALKKALDDPDPRVQEQAQQTLSSLHAK